MCQDIADSTEEGEVIVSIITDFSKAFDLVPHDWLFTKLAASCVDSKEVVWIREFLVGRTQKVRVWGQLSKKVKITSVVPQGNVFVPLLFLVYVNDIWSNIDASKRLFADSCIIYRKTTNKKSIKLAEGTEPFEGMGFGKWD